MVAPSNTPRSPCEEHAQPLNLDLHVHAFLSACSFSVRSPSEDLFSMPSA